MDADLVEAEMHRLEKLFHTLDLNGDGRIDIHELAQGLHKMGYYHITEEQIMVKILRITSVILIFTSVIKRKAKKFVKSNDKTIFSVDSKLSFSITRIFWIFCQMTKQHFFFS